MATKPSATPNPTLGTVLTINCRNNGSFRFDSPSGSDEPVVKNLYLEKGALADATVNGTIKPPKQGMIPGKIRVSVEIVDWVDAVTVQTNDQRKAALEAKRAAKAA